MRDFTWPNTSQECAAVEALLGDRTPLLVIRHGSWLYGTDHPQSDIDLRIVFLPSSEEILLGQVDFTLDNNPSSRPMSPGDLDIKGMSVMRFLTLLGKFDVTAIEMLFAAEREDAVLCAHPRFRQIIDARADLLATGQTTILGPVRKNLGIHMPDRRERDTRIHKILDVLSNLGDNDLLRDRHDLLLALDRIPGCDLILRQTKKEDVRCTEETIPRPGSIPASSTLFLSISGRMVDTGASSPALLSAVRGGLSKRPKGTPKGAGLRDVDGGDVAHAVRIMRQFAELSETGTLSFPRSDAAELRQVRFGQIKEEDLERIVLEAWHVCAPHDVPSSPFPTKRNEDTFRSLLKSLHLAVVTEKL